MSAVASIIEDIRMMGGLTGVDVANVTDVSKATVSRWEAGKAVPSTQKQLVLSDLRYIANRLAEFYAPDEARAWLYSRNDLLGGSSAMQLLNENRTEEVLDAIEQIRSLAYI